MDDYPRTHENVELMEHLDLKCWMYFFDQTLGYISNLLSNLDD